MPRWPPPLRARRGGPGRQGLRRAASPGPPFEAGTGPSKVFPRRLRGRQTCRRSCPGTRPSGAAAPARPHLQRRGAGGPSRGPTSALAALSRPKSTCGFGFFFPRVMHIFRNGAEHRDGHTGAFGCDGISPEGKAGQERGSPAAGLRGSPRGALPKLGARAGSPSPGSPLFPALASSPPPQNFPKYRLPLS